MLVLPMGSHLANRKWSCYLENWDISDVNNHLVHFLKSSDTILREKVDRCTTFSASCLFWLKAPFCFRCYRFSGKLILTTGVQINKDEVVCLYYALWIKLWVKFVLKLTFLIYRANIHNVSLRTFVSVYVQFEGIVHLLIVGIPVGTNCAPLIANLFFVLLWEGSYVSLSQIETVWPYRPYI